MVWFFFCLAVGLAWCWFRALIAVGRLEESEKVYRKQIDDLLADLRGWKDVKFLSSKTCGYCGKLPPYPHWNDGVCSECVDRIRSGLNGGVQVRWGHPQETVDPIPEKSPD